MRRTFISFSLLLYFAILPHWSYAAQIIGGDITYSCTTNDSLYVVELRIYSDADDTGSILDSIDYSSAVCGMFGSLELLLVSTTAIPQSCPALINVEERLFRDTLTLPKGCGSDWILSYSTCCRSNAITSGAANEGFYISANLDNTVAPCNNSPDFSSSNLIFTCDNAPVSYGQGAIETDGDSLVYSFVNCAQDPGNSVSYNMGFNGLQPLSTTSGFTIDAITGEINFTPTPDVVQVAPICVQVDEYRNGVKIGEIKRDILFVSKQAPVPVPVPTLGQWGVISLMLMMVIMGLVGVRKRIEV